MEQERYNDEKNLMDYVKVIIKRRIFILVVFLLAIILAGIFSFLSPKVYKIDTVLEIGRVSKEVAEAPAQLVAKIKSVYGTIYPEIKGIKAENPKDTALLEVGVESAEPERTINVLEKINGLILENHQGGIMAKKDLLDKDIERIRVKIDSLEEEKNSLESKVAALEEVVIYQQDPGSQFALFVAKEKLEVKKQEIENLYLKINSLERDLQDVRFTEVIKAPTVSEKPIKPRPLLNMVMAGILGLFVGIFLAFGREWWKNAK